ncbi:guanine nucleotide exchange factor [Anaeramoeba flamelloides]|uniref:Guanine nucleotide exchange factor n=1 Tax=Anaeramoeba flamelloides TaxID=1746091 RepID=A0ABQ8Z4F5_9EUKA|nr:guanine nucleotide exchange factor [Anaeramoeba flamelloides]
MSSEKPKETPTTKKKFLKKYQSFFEEKYSKQENEEEIKPFYRSMSMCSVNEGFQNNNTLSDLYFIFSNSNDTESSGANFSVDSSQNDTDDFSSENCGSNSGIWEPNKSPQKDEKQKKNKNEIQKTTKTKIKKNKKKKKDKEKETESLLSTESVTMTSTDSFEDSEIDSELNLENRSNSDKTSDLSDDLQSFRSHGDIEFSSYLKNLRKRKNKSKRKREKTLFLNRSEEEEEKENLEVKTLINETQMHLNQLDLQSQMGDDMTQITEQNSKPKRSIQNIKQEKMMDNFLENYSVGGKSSNNTSKNQDNERVTSKEKKRIDLQRSMKSQKLKEFDSLCQKSEFSSTIINKYEKIIHFSIDLVNKTLEKEEKTQKGLQNMAKLYKNKKKNLEQAIDFIAQTKITSNSLQLFKQQLYKNLIFLHFACHQENISYHVALKDSKSKNPNKLSFKKGDLIVARMVSKGKYETPKIEGRLKDQIGSFNIKLTSHLKKFISDKNYLKEQKKVRKPCPKIPKKINWKYLNLFDFDPQEIARQITLREFEIYSTLQYTEFLNQHWNKSEAFSLSKNIRKMIDKFNEFNYWCCTMMLQGEKIAQRVKAIKYFANMAMHFKKLNNFNSLMGVLSAFHSTSMIRLKHSFSSLSNPIKNKIKELDSMMSMQGAYKKYRHALNKAYRNGEPAIPFIGIHLTDLTFLDESNKNLDKDGKYSEKKFNGLIKVLISVLIFQTRPYTLKPIPQLRKYFENYPGLGDDKLYDLSLLREPRGSNIGDLK